MKRNYSISVELIFTCSEVPEHELDLCREKDPERCSFEVTREEFDKFISIIKKHGCQLENSLYVLRLESGIAYIFITQNTIDIQYYVDVLDVECEDVLKELELLELVQTVD